MFRRFWTCAEYGKILCWCLKRFLMKFGLLQQNTMIGVFYVGLEKEGKNFIMNITVNRPLIIMMDIKSKMWHSWQAHSLSESNLNLIKKCQTNCKTLFCHDWDSGQSSCQMTVCLMLGQYITNNISCYQLSRIRLFTEQKPVKYCQWHRS